MLTSAAYGLIAQLVAGRAEPPALAIAVGAGDRAWDETPPDPDRGRERLARELARRPADEVVFLDARGEPTDEPTAVVAVSAAFREGEAEGTLRECGLLARLDGRDVLLAYYVHPRIEVGPGGDLERRVRIDFTPAAVASGRRVTRWLGNARARELHDTTRETGACQLDEIEEDRRFYFASAEEARERGYDPCAFCIGDAET